MNYQSLWNEINSPTYAGMTDAEITAALNAETVTRQRVTIERLQATAMEVSVYVSLRTAIATPTTPPQVLALCQSALDLVNARFNDIDLDNPAAQSMFGALRQANIINAQQAAAIDALANVSVPSRATVLGLGVVSETDIATARTWMEIDALRQRLANGYNAAVATLDTAVSAPEWSDLIAVIEAA
jgi:hypothetical protein